MSEQTAGLMLQRLLSEPGRARKAWVAVGRVGTVPGEVSFAAVAQVIAAHLWDAGEVSDEVTGLARNLKDRVRRALRGEGMTAETLRWFAEAFDLHPRDRQQLEAALASSAADRVIAGKASADGLPVVNRCRSVSISEHHYLGADRCPAWHRTAQVIEPKDEGAASYLYMFDTNTIRVEARLGARSTGPIRMIRPGVFGVDIELLRPLSAGETAALMYESFFSYSEPPEPEFRRAAFEGVQSLDLRVEFHPEAVPKRVVFAEWDQLGHHEPSREQVVSIEDDLSVHRFLRSVDNSIVGFRWTWD